MERSLPSFRFKLLAGYMAWWLVWIGIQFIILLRLGFSVEISILDAAVTQVVLSVSGYAINTTLRYYNPKQIVRYICTWSLAIAFLATFLDQFIPIHVFDSTDPSYLNFLNQSRYIRAAFNWLMMSFVTLISWLYFNAIDNNENEKVKEAAERLAREAELSNLRMQLQPHFLFNSLNSISALIGTKPEQARTMIQQLSDFLRGTVKKDDRQLVTLDEELSHLQLYLEIEKIRFGHRLVTVIDREEMSLKATLPLLLLQPIVENAIKFGLYDTIGDITISIIAKIENQQLIIEIRNPFDASTSQPRTGTGFGLDSIRRRLYLMYFQNDLLQTTQNEGIFTTRLKIPQPS